MGGLSAALYCARTHARTPLLPPCTVNSALLHFFTLQGARYMQCTPHAGPICQGGLVKLFTQRIAVRAGAGGPSDASAFVCKLERARGD